MLSVACKPSHRRAPPDFYRSNAGATIDLLLTWPNGEHWAIAVKRGFYSACDGIKPVKKWLIYPGAEAYPLSEDIQAMPLHAAMRELAHRRGV